VRGCSTVTVLDTTVRQPLRIITSNNYGVLELLSLTTSTRTMYLYA
jgi:hypothetical protein